MSGSLLKILTLVTQVTFIYSSINLSAFGCTSPDVPSINKCKLSDSSCLTSSAQMATPALAAGVPEVGSEPLDVMHIDQIKVDLAGLKMNMNDVYIRGLKKATITKVEVDMEKKQLLLSWDCDILVKSHYKASGRLLILPISGDGNSTIKLKKLHTDMIIPFELTKNPEGKDMMNLKNFRFKFDIKDNAHFDLTNLFNGNKVLSEAMLKFMNENWGLLAQEFGKPMLEKPNKKIYEAVKKFLRSQPLENIVEV